jgi:Acetyltransferase (GNAT) domain
MRSRLRLLPGQPCPTLLLGEGRQLILTEILSKRSLRRREKKIGRLGSLGFRHLEDRDEIRRHLPRFFDQHILRRALAGGRSDLLVPENRLFFEHLIDALDPRRELRFGVLDLDGRPLAYHLGFEVGGRFTWYKPTFDVDYWDLSPGALLLKRLFEYVRDGSIEEFDFTRGDETFKDRFANHVRQNHTLHVYSRSLGGTILRLYDPARERLKATSWRPGILESALERRRIRKRLRLRRSSLGLDARAPKLVTRAWRALVFSRDEVLIYAAEKNRDDRADLPATSGLTLRKGCLSDLAALVRDCPALFDVEDLVDGRRRLRNGDLLFVSHSRGTIRHLAWCGARNDLAVPGARGPMPITLPSTRLLMFDWWVPASSGSGEAHSFALLEIVRRLPHEELWTLCRADDEVTRTAIERAGFSPRLRSGSIRLFGGIVRSWSVEEPGGHRR